MRRAIGIVLLGILLLVGAAALTSCFFGRLIGDCWPPETSFDVPMHGLTGAASRDEKLWMFESVLEAELFDCHVSPRHPDHDWISCYQAGTGNNLGYRILDEAVSVSIQGPESCANERNRERLMRNVETLLESLDAAGLPVDP